MGAAARIGDSTDHGGTIIPPPSVIGVLIEGQPAAVLGDQHKCAITPPPAHATISPVVKGSGSVYIGGSMAARANDRTGCGAGIVGGATSVQIGD